VARWAAGAGGGQVGGVLRHGEHFASLQFAVAVRPGARVRGEFLVVREAVDAGDCVVVRGERSPRQTEVRDRAQLSAYDLTCRSAYDLTCRSSGELSPSPIGW
jgi:hypothetical protein